MHTHVHSAYQHAIVVTETSPSPLTGTQAAALPPAPNPAPPQQQQGGVAGLRAEFMRQLQKLASERGWDGMGLDDELHALPTLSPSPPKPRPQNS